jgi:anti-anti-sigma regulatory factor
MWPDRFHPQTSTDHHAYVVATATMILAGALTSMLSMFAHRELNPALWVLHGLLVLVALGVIGLSRRGAVLLAARLLTSTLFVVVALATSPWLNGAVPTAHLLSVLVAGLLLGERAVLIVGMGALLTLIASAGLWTDHTISSLVLMFVATGLIWLTIRTLVRALARVQRETEVAQAQQAWLAAQQAALATTHQALAATHAQRTALLDIVRDLDVPVISVLDGVLVLPLIGYLDTRRAAHFFTRVLPTIQGRRAHVVLIDVTGISFPNGADAQHLLAFVQSVRLLGPQVVLTGLRPAVIQTIVQAGLSLQGVPTMARLQDALRVVLAEHAPTCQAPM